MITKETKAAAIAKMKCGASVEDVAAEHNIPLPLVKEWRSKFSEDDLMGLEANMFALQRTIGGQDIILPGKTLNTDQLKDKIEEVAKEIVDQISLTVTTGDVVRAKTLQLLADSAVKLYSTIVNKDAPGTNDVKPNGQTISAFKDLMRE